MAKLAKLNIKDLQGNVINLDLPNSPFAALDMSDERIIELLSRDFYTPTLDAKPTEDTLQYTDTDGEATDFRIGQACVYPDEEAENGMGISFLLAIRSDGKAVWGAGGGGTGSISVVITSNQGNDENIVSAVALFELVSTETGEGFEGGADVSIQDCSYKVSCTDVEGYNTPEPQIVAMSSSAQTVYFEYTCEKVIITATPPDGIDISELVVTVTDSEGKVWLEEPYGTGLTCNIPFGTIYSVTMQRISGYVKQKYTYTAGIDQREVNYEFTAINESYMIIDTKDKTTGRVSVLNPNRLNSIISNIDGVMMKRNGSKVCITYLSQQDNGKYYNGTTANTDGSEGDVMTCIPDVYYRFDDIGNGQVRYSITSSKPDDGYHHIPKCYIGQMKASVVDGVMRSVSGQTPVSGKSYNELLELAKNRGDGFGLIDWEAHCLIAMLLYCKYGTTDIQSAIGESKSYYNADNTTGTSLSLGETDSHPAEYNDNLEVVTEANYTTWNRALCLEGVFGGLYEYMQGVKYVNGTWYVTDRDGTERAIKTEDCATGWITDMELENGPRFDLIPTGSSGGSGSTYYADYAEMASGDFIATHAARGCFSDPNAEQPFPDDGVAYINATTGANEPSEFYGTRLAYYGNASIYNVSNFLSIENVLS